MWFSKVKIYIPIFVFFCEYFRRKINKGKLVKKKWGEGEREEWGKPCLVLLLQRIKK